MKKAKLNNSKKSNKKEEELVQNNDISIRMGVITVVILIVAFVGFYFLTDYLLSKRTNTTLEPPTVEANPNEIAFNSLLKQKESEYYVLAILESDKDNTSKYERYVRTLSKVYYIDMTDSFNKNHIGEETVVGESAKDIVISDTALFHVKGGKVEGYYVGYDDITEYLISLAKK